MRKSLVLANVFAIILTLSSCNNGEETNIATDNNPKSDSTVVELSEIERLNNLVESNPNSADVYMQRAKHYHDSRNMRLAFEDYQSAYNLDSNNTDVVLAYADFLPKTGNAEEAFRLYKKVLVTKGKNKKAFLGLSYINALLNNHKEALQFADSALTMDIHYRDAYMMKAMIFRNSGRFKEMVSSYQTTLEQDPNFIPAYVALGNVYANRANRSEQDILMSENYYNSALEIDSTNSETLYGKGMLLQGVGRFDDAIHTYEKLLSFEPTFSNAAFNQGFIYLNLKVDLDSAIYYFEKTVKMDSVFFQAYHNLGEAYRRKGDKETALTHYKSAIKINPEYQLSIDAAQNIYK